VNRLLLYGAAGQPDLQNGVGGGAGQLGTPREHGKTVRRGPMIKLRRPGISIRARQTLRGTSVWS